MIATVSRRVALSLAAATLALVGLGLVVTGPAAEVATVATQYMDAYNTLAMALTPDTPNAPPGNNRQDLPRQHAAIATFRDALAAMHMPDRVRGPLGTLRTATTRLLDLWVEPSFTGMPLPGGADPSTVPIAALHQWYQDAAVVGSALGLDSTDAVAYPTVPALPECTRSQITVNASRYPTAFEQAGDVSVGVGLQRTALCAVDAAVTVSVVDARGVPAAVHGNPYHTRLTIAPLNYATTGLGFSLVWANWCGAAGDYSMRVQIDGLAQVVALGGAGLPTCRDVGAASTLVKQ